MLASELPVWRVKLSGALWGFQVGEMEEENEALFFGLPGFSFFLFFFFL